MQLNYLSQLHKLFLFHIFVIDLRHLHKDIQLLYIRLIHRDMNLTYHNHNLIQL